VVLRELYWKNSPDGDMVNIAKRDRCKKVDQFK
jgi:hypothetical protein